jgi:predicted type IV restriction endonuclease
LLIEVKAIGLDLKPGHLKQAVDYAANKGIEWVMLTNGLIWEIYRVFFAKPINQELVLRIDFSTISHKNDDDINELYVLSREGMDKNTLDKYFIQKKALSKYYIGAIVLSPSILGRIKRQIKRISPEVKVTEEQIKEVIETDVLKREILESEKYKEALKAINRARRQRERAAKEDDDEEGVTTTAAKEENLTEV